MRNRSFAQEEDQGNSGSTTDGANEPEYTFEGFKVEFSEKVMLTPPGPQGKK